LSCNFLFKKLIDLIFDCLNFILQALLAGYQIVYLLALYMVLAVHSIVRTGLDDEFLLVFVRSVELPDLVQLALTFQ
jgi:hypothetical protein